MEDDHENQRTGREKEENSTQTTESATNTQDLQEIPVEHIPGDENSNLPVNPIPATQNRRGSLPTGLMEHHVHTNRLCGRILRVMGDDHYSKACGQHLRYMGDEMCLSYQLRHRYIAIRQSSINSSHSEPDLRREF